MCVCVCARGHSTDEWIYGKRTHAAPYFDEMLKDFLLGVHTLGEDRGCVSGGTIDWTNGWSQRGGTRAHARTSVSSSLSNILHPPPLKPVSVNAWNDDRLTELEHAPTHARTHSFTHQYQSSRSASDVKRGHPLSCSHCLVSECPKKVASTSVPSFQGHPFSRAYLSISKCPSLAAPLHVSSFHGHPFSCKYLSMSR